MQFKYEYSPVTEDIYKYHGKFYTVDWYAGRLILFDLFTGDYHKDICGYKERKPVAKIVRPMWKQYVKRWCFTKKVIKTGEL